MSNSVGPKAYIEARCKAEAMLEASASSSNNTNITTTTRFEIDGKPYLPLLMATDDNSMKQIVIEIFDLLEDDALAESDIKLDIVPITGGNTNKLFCISGIPTSKVPNSKVLLRIFGGEGMIDRDIETSTYAALAQAKIALPYYGRFGNGRLEQWCDTMTVLNDSEMSLPHISASIAKQLATLHKTFQIPEYLKEYHDINSKPTLWTQLEEWYSTAQNHHDRKNFLSPNDTKRSESLKIPKLENELEWLRTSVIQIPSSSSETTSSSNNSISSFQVGFCHNDILASNILCPTNTATKDNNNEEIKLQLLDFEYGGINFEW